MEMLDICNSALGSKKNCDFDNPTISFPTDFMVRISLWTDIKCLPRLNSQRCDCPPSGAAIFQLWPFRHIESPSLRLCPYRCLKYVAASSGQRVGQLSRSDLAHRQCACCPGKLWSDWSVGHTTSTLFLNVCVSFFVNFFNQVNQGTKTHSPLCQCHQCSSTDYLQIISFNSVFFSYQKYTSAFALPLSSLYHSLDALA